MRSWVRKVNQTLRMVKVVKAYCNNHNDSNYNEYYEEGTEKQGRPPVCKNGHQSANLKKNGHQSAKSQWI